jgi:hypothetical protein
MIIPVTPGIFTILGMTENDLPTVFGTFFLVIPWHFKELGYPRRSWYFHDLRNGWNSLGLHCTGNS